MIEVAPPPVDDVVLPVNDVLLPEALRRCFHSLDSAGIKWCLLRMPPEGEAGDIDLLVAAGQLDAACTAAKAAGFVRVPGHAHGRNLLLYAPSAERWFWLHVVDEISFGPFYRLQTGAEAACLWRVESRGGVRRLHPADEFWITLLHCLLDKGRIKPRHRDGLQQLVHGADDEGPMQARIASLGGTRCSVGELIHCVKAGEWDRLEERRTELLERWLRHGPVRPSPGLLQRVKGAVAFRLRGWHRRGISVALLGPDGAGKTTLAGEIVGGFAFPARRVYMGLTGGALRFVHRVRIPGVVLAGQVVVLWARCLYAFALRSRGYLVVFDRYVYDAAVPTPHRLSGMQRASRWVAGHVCPQPDLIVVLNAPGDVMYRRKRAYTAAQLDDWRQHFLRLRTRFPNLEVIDTTLPLNRVRAEVFERIWRQYAERWE
jgi:thymidylate kinase